MAYDSLVRTRQLNKPELSGYVVDVLLQYLKTGAITGIAMNTGQLTGQFYPLQQNPSGYVVTSQLTGYATQLQVTGNNAYVQSWVDINYYPRNNPSGYIGTGFIDTGLLPRTGTIFSKTESFTLFSRAYQSPVLAYRPDNYFIIRDEWYQGLSPNGAIINLTPGDAGSRPYISGFNIYTTGINGGSVMTSQEISGRFIRWDYVDTGKSLSFNYLSLLTSASSGTPGSFLFTPNSFQQVGYHTGFPSENHVIDLYGSSYTNYALASNRPFILGFDINAYDIKSSGYGVLTTKDLTGLTSKSDFISLSGQMVDADSQILTTLLDYVTGATGLIQISGAGNVSVSRTGTLIIISGSGGAGNMIDDGTYVRTTGNQSIYGDKIFYDSSSKYSLRIDARYLYDLNNIMSVDWGMRQTFDNVKGTSVDWQSRLLQDNFSNVTVDWQSGWLKSGNVINLDWKRRILSGSWNIRGDLTISGQKVLTGNYILTNASTQNFTGTLNIVSGKLQVSGKDVTTGGPYYPRGANPSGYMTMTGVVALTDDFDSRFFQELSGLVIAPVIDISIDSDGGATIPSNRYILQVQGYKTGVNNRIVYSEVLSSGIYDNPGNFDMLLNWNPLPSYPVTQNYILTLWSQPYGGGGPVNPYPTGAWALSLGNKNGIDWSTLTWHSGTTGRSPLGAIPAFVTWTGFIVDRLQVTGQDLTGKIILSGVGGTSITTSGNIIFISGGGGSGTSGPAGGVNNINVAGQTISGNVSFTGISGVGVSISGNTVVISGGGAPGNVTNNYTMNSGSGIFFYRSGIASGVGSQFINFPALLDTRPIVIATIHNDINMSLLGCQISGANPTGFWAIFSATTNSTGYYLDVIAANSTSTGMATNVIINNYNTVGGAGGGVSSLVVTGNLLSGSITFTGAGNISVVTGIAGSNQIVISGATGNLVFQGMTGQFLDTSDTGTFVNRSETGTLAAYGSVVFTTGNQTILGQKTFSSTMITQLVSATSLQVSSTSASFQSGLFNQGLETFANVDCHNSSLIRVNSITDSGFAMAIDVNNHILTGTWTIQTLAGTGQFVDSSKTGQYITTAQTGQFAPSGMTGQFITTAITGNAFYPRFGNPAGYITSASAGSVSALVVTGTSLSGSITLTGAGNISLFTGAAGTNQIIISGSASAGSSSSTFRHVLYPENAQFMTGLFPQYDVRTGVNFPISVLAFDSGNNESATWKFDGYDYTGTSLNLDIFWYASTGTPGGSTVWVSQMAALSANTDSFDVETKTISPLSTGLSTHLGTTLKRMHKFTLSITGLDAFVANDIAWITIARSGSHVSDTLTGDALFERAILRT